MRVDGVAAWRGDLRRAAAGEDTDVGVAADEGDGARGGGERKDCGTIVERAVLQENDALFFEVPGVVAAAEGIDHAGDGRVVDSAGGEHAAHDVESADRVVLRQRSHPFE